MKTKSLVKERNIFLHGRYYLKDNYTHLDFSGAGFSVEFEGKQVAIEYEASNTENESIRPFLAVLVDDELYQTIEVSNPTGKLVLFSSEKAEHHVLQVVKNTECPVNHIGYKNLEIEGKIIKNIGQFNKHLKCLIFGDSVTCGYGIDASEQKDYFLTKDENYLKSYAYRLGKLLNMEVVSIACGGFPIYQSPYSRAYKIDSIPDLINLASFDINSTLETAPRWKNRKYIPDLILINLGANDNPYLNENDGVSKEDKISKITSKLRLFVQELRGFFPKAKIVIMSNLITLSDEINMILDRVSKEEKTYRFISTAEKEIGGFHPALHPSNEMHIYGAKELKSYLLENVL